MLPAAHGAGPMCPGSPPNSRQPLPQHFLPARACVALPSLAPGDWSPRRLSSSCSHGPPGALADKPRRAPRRLPCVHTTPQGLAFLSCSPRSPRLCPLSSSLCQCCCVMRNFSGLCPWFQGGRPHPWNCPSNRKPRILNPGVHAGERIRRGWSTRKTDLVRRGLGLGPAGLWGARPGPERGFSHIYITQPP